MRVTIYLLNSLIVPVDFRKHERVSVTMRYATIDEVRQLLRQEFVSAIGHESTATLLSQLLGINVPMNRIAVSAAPGDVLIHFALRTRLPEGRVLSEEELRQLDYYFVISEVHGDVPPQRGLKGAVVDEIRNNWMRVRIGDKLYRIFAVCYQCGDGYFAVETEAPPQRGV